MASAPTGAAAPAAPGSTAVSPVAFAAAVVAVAVAAAVARMSCVSRAERVGSGPRLWPRPRSFGLASEVAPAPATMLGAACRSGLPCSLERRPSELLNGVVRLLLQRCKI